MPRRIGWAVIGFALLGAPAAAEARCEAPGSGAFEPDAEATLQRSLVASAEAAAAAAPPPAPKPAPAPAAARKAARGAAAKRVLPKDKAAASRSP